MIKACKLVLEDGAEFEGFHFGADVSAAGEVVFNTAMTGYPESLSDPSYKGQLLTLTYPLVGNYGVPQQSREQDMKLFYESDCIHAAGLVVSEYSFQHSHWNAETSLDQWLKNHGVPGIYGIDTRLLTQRIREKGSLAGKIVMPGKDIPFSDPDKVNLVAEVSTTEKKIYSNGSTRILLIDCGVKNNIIRSLLELDATVIRVPWDYDITGETYDGILVSNGPGDPRHCEATIKNLQLAMKEGTPIFGICLGNQLLALAAGASTYKLKYGHRGHNQPVIQAGTSKAFITSQNHGFAVDNATLPKDWEPWFLNLNDNTNEGLRHKTKPFISTQFHPEAHGGPRDTHFLFQYFLELIEKQPHAGAPYCTARADSQVEGMGSDSEHDTQPGSTHSKGPHAGAPDCTARADSHVDDTGSVLEHAGQPTTHGKGVVS